MSRAVPVVLTAVAIAAHMAVAVAVQRRAAAPTLLAWINLAFALCVLGYWVQRWYGFVVRGVTWYLSDQFFPFYALVVAVVAVLALSGRLQASWPQWLFFGVHVITLVAALLFFAFFRLTRLF